MPILEGRNQPDLKIDMRESERERERESAKEGVIQQRKRNGRKMAAGGV